MKTISKKVLQKTILRTLNVSAKEDKAFTTVSNSIITDWRDSTSY